MEGRRPKGFINHGADSERSGLAGGKSISSFGLAVIEDHQCSLSQQNDEKPHFMFFSRHAGERKDINFKEEAINVVNFCNKKLFEGNEKSNDEKAPSMLFTTFTH